MAEDAPLSRSPEVMSMVAPDYVGAVFETGKIKSTVVDTARSGVREGKFEYKFLVPVFNIKDDLDRRAFAFRNIRVFNNGQVASPEKSWKPIVDFWLSEQKVAADRGGLDREEREEFEKDIKAMMAVSASARAMEKTAGSAAAYVEYITGAYQTGKVDLDVKDKWADFLLHGDEKKLQRVISDPLVARYYGMLMKDAGYEWNESEEKWEEGDKPRFVEKALKGRLVDYLRTENPYKDKKKDDRYKDLYERWERFKKGIEVEIIEDKDGKEKEVGRVVTRNDLDDYIAEELLAKDDKQFIEDQMGKEIDDECRWAAAKLATDAFLVDRFTQWEYDIDKKGDFKLKPCPEWGGDPFRALLEPSFLPRVIKKVYKEDAGILTMLDRALRPDDLLREGSDEELKRKIKKSLPVPSATIHLKKYARFNEALSAILGGSRAPGLPQWTKDTVGRDLPSALELLDQVYGDAEAPEGQEIKLGKHLMGVITTRVLEVKALAAALESTKPGFRDNMAILFGEEKERPFLEVLQFLYGPQYDYKRGFIDSLLGGRTRFIFRNNIFGAEKDLKEVWEILRTTDQDSKTRGRALIFEKLRFVVEVASALEGISGRKRS